MSLRSHPASSRQESRDTLRYLLILLAGALIFGAYIKLPLAVNPDEWSWLVEQAYRGARAPGGAAHPLLFVLNNVVSLLGVHWMNLPPADLLLFCHGAVAALGVTFFGWYLVQRFGSLAVAVAGMLIVGFSLAFWRGALSMGIEQLALTLYLGALCCVGRPAYGRRISRLRDMLAVCLCTAALLASQSFLILIPAFLHAASEETRQRGQFLLFTGILYLVCQVAFIYQYVLGPSELFTATTTEGKIAEWVKFQPPESGALVLKGDAGEMAGEGPLTKIGLVLEAGVHGVVALSGDKTVVYLLWFALGSLTVAMTTIQSIRRDVMGAVLTMVPLLALTYLQEYIVMQRLMPVSVGVAILGCAFAGFVMNEFESFLRYFGVAVLLGIVAPAVILLNYSVLAAGTPLRTGIAEVTTPSQAQPRGDELTQ